MLDALPRILARISQAALWLSGVGLVVMTALVAWQIYGRYVLNDSPSWTEPAALLLMSWFIMLGAAVGVREGGHLGFAVGLQYVPAVLRRLMLAATEILVAGFGMAMVWYGVQLAAKMWSADMASIALPQGVVYLPLVFGGVLITVFSLEKLALLLIAKDETPLVRDAAADIIVVKD